MGLIDGFILGRLVAQNAGIQDQGEANRIGLVVGATGGSATSIAVGAILARQQGSGAGKPPPGGVAVPDVTTSDFARANSVLKGLGLGVVRQDVVSDRAAVGTVVSESPAAGTVVAAGSTVTLSVSKGIALPNVVGEHLDDAADQLGGLNLNVQFKADENAVAAAGTVTAQDPPAGTQVGPKTTVTLTVSGALVPDVTGKAYDEAQTELAKAPGRFKAERTDVPAAALDSGSAVADQEPEFGRIAAPGDTVRLTVLIPPPIN